MVGVYILLVGLACCPAVVAFPVGSYFGAARRVSRAAIVAVGNFELVPFEAVTVVVEVRFDSNMAVRLVE